MLESLCDCETIGILEDDDEHEDDSSDSEFRLNRLIADP